MGGDPLSQTRPGSPAGIIAPPRPLEEAPLGPHFPPGEKRRMGWPPRPATSPGVGGYLPPPPEAGSLRQVPRRLFWGPIRHTEAARWPKTPLFFPRDFGDGDPKMPGPWGGLAPGSQAPKGEPLTRLIPGSGRGFHPEVIHPRGGGPWSPRNRLDDDTPFKGMSALPPKISPPQKAPVF